MKSVASAPAPIVSRSSTSVISNTIRKTQSRSSVKSANTVTFKELAAKLEYAKRLASIETEREKSIAERQKAIAELELQTELAAIACSSAQSSKTNYIEDWLDDSQNKSIVAEQSNPIHCAFRETHEHEALASAPESPVLISRPLPLDPAHNELSNETFLVPELHRKDASKTAQTTNKHSYFHSGLVRQSLSVSFTTKFVVAS
ncbi:hypothetical protein ACJJTC_005901 [Scirpophaga incertulas]